MVLIFKNQKNFAKNPCWKFPVFEITKNPGVFSNKKGVFFTILVIFMLTLFLVSYSFYYSSQDRDAINKRIETMNNFVLLVERDLPRHLYVSGYRVIVLFEKRISETGNYIEDVNQSFKEAFFNGSIDGTYDNIMNGATFWSSQDSYNILNVINESAKRINLIINFYSTNVFIEQEDPWRLKVTLVTGISIKDRGNLASWNKTFIISSYIPIYNFEDPIYTLNTEGKWNKKINRTIYEPLVNGDLTNLSLHLSGSYYVNSTLAPSFLDRLEGNLSGNNPNGIESLVNLPALSAVGIEVKTKSDVDYIYFSDSDPQPIHSIDSPMPNWFRLEDAHVNFYGIDPSKVD